MTIKQKAAKIKKIAKSGAIIMYNPTQKDKNGVAVVSDFTQYSAKEAARQGWKKVDTTAAEPKESKSAAKKTADKTTAKKVDTTAAEPKK